MRRLASGDEGLTLGISLPLGDGPGGLVDHLRLGHDGEMPQDAPADDPPQSDGHRVADQAAQALEMDRRTLWDEGVVLRETLQDRSFAQRQRPILLGVSEATVAETVELGGEGRGGFVPNHAAIDTGVCPAAITAVTFRNQTFG